MSESALPEGVARWQAPSLGAREPVHGSARPVTANELAEIEAQAHDAGYQRGLQEGRQAGAAERQREAERLREVVESLSAGVSVLDDALLEQISAVVMTIARQFVRRELHAQPGEVVRVVREAVAALPASESRIRVMLHPQDAALVSEALHLEGSEQPWHIVEDPTVSRGGAHVETDVSSVDATLESRLGAIAARLLPEERWDGGDA